MYRTWERAGRNLGRAVLASVVATLALLFAAERALGQEPLVEVRLNGVGTELVQGRMDARGRLQLPVGPLEDLTGEDLGPGSWLDLETLQDRLGPQVRVEYRPRQALVVVHDTYDVLAASESDRAEAEAAARSEPPDLQSGPWATAVTDGRDASVRAGFDVWRLTASATYSTVNSHRWTLSARPLDRVWVSYRDGIEFDPRLSLRASRGPFFGTASVNVETRQVDGRASAVLGPFTVFGTTSRTGGVGFRGDEFSVVLGRSADDRYLVRTSIGARRFSTVAVPRIR